MAFARFMSSTTGRLLRIIAGLALIALGVFYFTGTTGIIVALIGVVPLLAGVFNVCVFAPLFGGPFNGRAVK
ncbi:MAG TPA: DUF2892 domain-containing protein [Aggregatilineales bacterium]|nr:DUF2892 domain-containing protein [Aggregatilineales bacterium]